MSAVNKVIAGTVTAVLSTLVLAADAEIQPIDPTIVAFDFQQAEAVARGTIVFNSETNPGDGIGVYGGGTEVDFIPVVVLKGQLEAGSRYSVNIPNAFLSYQSTHMTRDRAYMQRQELQQEMLRRFSAEYASVDQAHEAGVITDSDFSKFSEIADIVAMEIQARSSTVRVRSHPLKPKTEIPLEKVVFDGNTYTLFLGAPLSEDGRQLVLSTRDRSIFGGLENYYVEKLVHGSSGSAP